MTDAKTPSSQGGLLRVNQTLRDLTTLISTIAALIAALYALYNSFAAHEISVNAKKTANNTAATLAAQANVTEQPVTTAAPSSNTYTLQLATYQTKDCSTAEQEIAGYDGAFSKQPTLWRDPAGQYVIIGIQADDLDAAQKLQHTARALSQQPAQAGNDLANAIIRKAPPWTALKSCPPA